MAIENAIIIVNKTRLEDLTYRFNTKQQAKFYIEQSGAAFEPYVAENDTFYSSLDKLEDVVSRYLKYKVLDRKYLPRFIFSENDIAIVVGQDGLVANAAKYTKGIPILSVNPDVNRYDGILLLHNLGNFEQALIRMLEGKATYKKVTMAEVVLNDGQKLLAFNDFFIGPSSHLSARYKIQFKGKEESQSSSGLIVSTGAGSTGWLSSLFNMSNGMFTAFTNSPGNPINMRLGWEENKLVFVVREPFRSKSSDVTITAGVITKENKLELESFMPTNGVIFSDGIEQDFLKFNSGSIAHIGVSEQKALIVAG